MTATLLTAAELAARVRRHDLPITRQQALEFLQHWVDQGIVEEVLPGRFKLSEQGAAIFGGVALAIYPDDERQAA